MAGLGIDIEDISRVRDLCQRFGQRFLERVYSPWEIEYCYRHANPFPHLTARFAAKEAYVKAGTRPIPPFPQVEVRNDEHGAPHLWLRGELAAGCLVSLSHTQETAIAVILRLEPR
jgi:holo-[acyl-carrier protein] synthase